MKTVFNIDEVSQRFDFTSDIYDIVNYIYGTYRTDVLTGYMLSIGDRLYPNITGKEVAKNVAIEVHNHIKRNLQIKTQQNQSVKRKGYIMDNEKIQNIYELVSTKNSIISVIELVYEHLNVQDMRDYLKMHGISHSDRTKDELVLNIAIVLFFENTRGIISLDLKRNNYLRSVVDDLVVVDYIKSEGVTTNYFRNISYVKNIFLEYKMFGSFENLVSQLNKVNIRELHSILTMLKGRNYTRNKLSKKLIVSSLLLYMMGD